MIPFPYFIAQSFGCGAFLQYALPRFGYPLLRCSIKDKEEQAMNRIMQEQWPMFEAMRTLRLELTDALTDTDLAFTPGGQAMTLGALCCEMGELDQVYMQSFSTFKHDWTAKKAEPGVETSVAKLVAWFESLEEQRKAAITALSDEDLEKTVDRDGYPIKLEYQVGAYLQALLIFFGKATIYLRAMDKPLPEKMREWLW
jgi:uncharacterized damage-inducible protein DinB